jgi:hypothetical protein
MPHGQNSPSGGPDDYLPNEMGLHISKINCSYSYMTCLSTVVCPIRTEDNLCRVDDIEVQQHVEAEDVSSTSIPDTKVTTNK